MFARLPQHLLVARRTDAVEDDAGDPDLRVERREAVQQSRDAVALTAAVDHQDHRRAQQGSHVRGGSFGGPCEAVGDPAVEQSHHTFDDRDIRRRAAMPVQRADQLFTDEHRVEVAARLPCGQRMVSGVDEVRSDLERCHSTARST